MKRRPALIAIAVVLATIGTVGVYAYLHGADKRAAGDSSGAAVVIATKRIAAGTSWKDAVHGGDMSVEHLPSSATPGQALHGLDAGVAEDAVAQSDIAPGSPVLREVFGPATSQTGVLAIPKGLIAITISLSADANVAGYVGPRSQVAIFTTAPLKTKKDTADQTTSGDELTVTRTVVPRALVIASSQAAPTSLVASSDSSSTSSNDASVLVTLALSQQDAERVINQQKVGSLTLGLLSATSHISQDEGYVNAGVFESKLLWAR